MKKGIKISLATVLTACLFMPPSQAGAQNMYDAYRYSQQQWEGTARSMAMGNAGVALGGDMGFIAINPAASGVYRYSELIFTPGITNGYSTAGYLGTQTSDNKTRFGVSSFGYVGSFETGRTSSGLINWNIGVVFNKANNYTSRMSAAGRTDQSSWLASLAQGTEGINSSRLNINSNNDPFYAGLPWKSVLGWNTSLLDNFQNDNRYIGATENIYSDAEGEYVTMGGAVDQRYYNETVGSTNEVSINFGGNFSNKLFFGLNLGIQNIWYKYTDVYSETAVNPSQFQTGFEHFSHSYTTRTSGTGVNLKFGLIYLPFKGLRLGASVSTPTWMYLYDEWEENMTARMQGTVDNPEPYRQTLTSPLGNYNYQVNTPFRWNVGAAYTLGNIGALSVDYEQANYSQMKMNDRDSFNEFAEENRMIKQAFTRSNILRAGAEIKFTPEIAFRAGYQHYTSGEIDPVTGKAMDTKLQYGSLGLGFVSKSGFFADIAYQQVLNKTKESFWLYDDLLGSNNSVIAPAPEGIHKYGNFKILLSLGFRF